MWVYEYVGLVVLGLDSFALLTASLHDLLKWWLKSSDVFHRCEKERVGMTKLSKLAAVDCWHCGQWGFVLSHMPRHGHQVLDISSCKCLFVCLRVLNHYYFYCFVASSYFPFYSVTSRITQARQKHAPETLHIFHPWKRTQGMMGKQHAQNRSALFPLYSAWRINLQLSK